MQSSTPMGAVLAGGHSRRMGRDKALLSYRGQPLIQSITRVLGSVLPEVVIVSPHRKEYEFLGLPILPDIHPNGGPLGGIHTALTHAGCRPVFVLACDLPCVGKETVQYILEYPAGEGASPRNRPGEGESGQPPLARIPVEEGRLQPLCALYFPACRDRMEERLNRRQFKMQDFLDGLRIIPVPVTNVLPFYRKELFLNINCMEDYEGILKEKNHGFPGTDHS